MVHKLHFVCLFVYFSEHCLVSWSYFFVRLWPHDLWLACCCGPCQPLFRLSCCWNFVDTTLEIPRRQNLTTNSLNLWVLQSFYSLFHNAPWNLSADDISWMYSLRLVSTSLHFDWLWFYVMLSIAKRSFLSVRGELHLPVGVRTKMERVVRDCAGLVR